MKTLLYVLLFSMFLNCCLSRNLQDYKQASNSVYNNSTVTTTNEQKLDDSEGASGSSNYQNSSITICGSTISEGDCNYDYSPVCGYIEGCEDSDCWNTYQNDCKACASGVSYFMQKECAETTESPDASSSVPKTYTNCTISERDVDFCDEEYKPTCGYVYSESCSNNGIDTCFKQFTNPCYACKDKATYYHYDGYCDNVEVDSSNQPDNKEYTFADRHVCNDEDRGVECSTDDYIPVCAFKKDCNPDKEICFVTVNNKCEACSNSDYVEYAERDCPKPIECNDDSRNLMCPAYYKGVCAISNNCNDSSDYCINTTGTGCQACSDPTVKEYYDFECYLNTPYYAFVDSSYQDVIFYDEQNKEKQYCSDDTSYEMCTEEYIGVCGHMDDESCKENCELTFSNYCYACRNKSISYITKGVCSYQASQIIEERYAYSLSKAAESEASSSYDTDNLNKTSISSSQTDMSTATKVYQAYVCTSSDRNKECNVGNSNTCGFKTCASGKCPIEKSNKCVACLDNSVEYIVEESCSALANSRVYIPCTQSDKNAEVCITQHQSNYKVCGVNNLSSDICLKEGCESSYTSICKACAVDSVKQYYEGECSSSFIASQYIFIIMIVLISLFYV